MRPFGMRASMMKKPKFLRRKRSTVARSMRSRTLRSSPTGTAKRPRATMRWPPSPSRPRTVPRQTDIYQQNTNITDESGQAYGPTIDALLDNAIGANGYYGVFGANMHTDYAAPHAGAETIVASAQARGVPVISYKQLLDWVDGRNASTIRGMDWDAGVFTFATTIGTGARGLQTMLPTQGPSGTLSALTCGGSPRPYRVQTIKGVPYAMFDAITGTCRATYS